MTRTTLQSHTTEDFDRFWSKVDASGDCWEWIASKNQIGYGIFFIAGGMKGAHRVGWQMLMGPLGSELTLDHLCRNRGCVNPDHLEPVSQKVNLNRGHGIGGSLRTHCPKGHPYDEANTYLAPPSVSRGGSKNRMCRTCRAERAKAKNRGPRALVTECLRGHPYSEENTYRTKKGQRQCRTCKAERAATQRPRVLVTECPKGHSYDEANTYRTKKGQKQCRTCRRERMKAARIN